MTANDRFRPSDLSDEELAGFVEMLVLSNEELPDGSDGVMAYVERLASSVSLDEDAVSEVARKARSAIIRQNLGAAQPRPIRPLGSHMLAKRMEASCNLADVAVLLGERDEGLRAIEKRKVSPFDLGAQKLASIVEVFAFDVSEFREALTLELTEPPTATPGLAFPRATEAEEKPAALSLAADDLRRAAGPIGASADPVQLKLIDEIIAAVQSELKRHRLTGTPD